MLIDDRKRPPADSDCRTHIQVATKPDDGERAKQDAEKPADDERIGPRLLKQFKRWAKSLLKVNPGYVKDPSLLRRYVQGPNWDDPDWEYAHYKECIQAYGKELLGMFERLRTGNGDRGLEEYRSLLKAAGIEEAV